jgi:hypothetical protein
MLSSVYFRSKLAEAQIKTVQRQQFAPTTKKHQEYYRGQQEILYHLFEAEKLVEEYTSIEDFLRPMSKDKGAVKKRPLDELAILKSGFKLTIRDLGTIINAKRQDEMRRSGEPGMVNEYLKMICQYINTVRNKEIAMKGPSCVTFTSEQYHKIRQGRGGQIEPLCTQTL